jgi:hypothetical protein
MSRYLVTVTTTVVVEARNVMDAKAKGETALRQAVKFSYREDVGRFGDGWERFGFQAKKSERLTDDD